MYFKHKVSILGVVALWGNHCWEKSILLLSAKVFAFSSWIGQFFTPGKAKHKMAELIKLLGY